MHEQILSHLQNVLGLADQVVNVSWIDESLVGRHIVSPLQFPVVENKSSCERTPQAEAVPGLVRAYVAVEAGVHFFEAINDGELAVRFCHGLQRNQEFFLLESFNTFTVQEIFL